MTANSKNKETVFEPESIRFFRELLEESKKDKSKTFKLAKEDIMPSPIEKRRVINCNDKLWEHIEQRAMKYNVHVSAALRYVLAKGLGI